MLSNKLLIIGTPRSGTYYTSLLLQKMGYDVQQEKWGEDGMVSWAGMFPDAYYGKYKPGCIVLHQLHDPIEVINSLNVLSHPAWSYIQDAIPDISKREGIVRNIRMYALWNKMCGAKAVMTFRVEDLDIYSRYNIPRNTNTRKTTKAYKYGTWNWGDILETHDPFVPLVVSYANRYSYPLPDMCRFAKLYGVPSDQETIEDTLARLIYKEIKDD